MTRLRKKFTLYNARFIVKITTIYGISHYLRLQGMVHTKDSPHPRMRGV